MLKPLGDRVLVKPGEAEEVSSGGIVLPDTARKRPREGEVLAVGPGKLLDSGKRAPMQVSVGEVVVYAEYGGTEVKVGDEEYVLLSEDDLLAVNPKPKKKGKGKK